MLAPGTPLGVDEIIGVVGAGGTGEVYRAPDPRPGRDVAIKVLPSLHADDADRLRRFEPEARAAAALNNPHIRSTGPLDSRRDGMSIILVVVGKTRTEV